LASLCTRLAPLALFAAPLAAQQFVYNAAALPAQNVWTDGVEIADIDKDGDNDILFANGSAYGGAGAAGAQPQHLFLNNGSGVFVAAHAQLNVANFNAKMVIAEDLDNDGDLDLAYASGSTGSTARILMNNGTGTFSDETLTRFPQTLFPRSFCICAGDVDNDGDLDLAINDGGTFGGIASQSRLYLNNGSGFFTDATATNLPVDLYNSQDITLIDFDNDLDLDYLQTGKGGAGKQARLWLNNGSGVFTIDSALNAVGTGGTYEGEFGDVDGDRDIDGLIQSISGFNEGIAYNQGVGVPMTPLVFPGTNGGDDNEMAGFDYDNDGDLDVFVGSLAAQEKAYRNDGANVWTYVGSVIQAQADSTLDLGIGDLNGDKKYDIVTAQGESGNFTDKVYFNNGPADTQPPKVLKIEQPALGNPTTVFRGTFQDAIQDDGKAKFYSVSYLWVSNSPSGSTVGSGTAFHQGGGTWRATVPTPAGTSGVCINWRATDIAGNSTGVNAKSGTPGNYGTLGGGAGGSFGVPILSGAGTLTSGAPLTLTIAGGAPNAPGALVVGGSLLNVPYGAGVIIPTLDQLTPFFTDGTGTKVFNLNWPTGLPSCHIFLTQAGILDASVPGTGIAMTNGLALSQN
jgi:hypothetical protein